MSYEDIKRLCRSVGGRGHDCLWFRSKVQFLWCSSVESLVAMTTAEAAELAPTFGLAHEKSKKAESALSTGPLCPAGALAPRAGEQSRQEGEQSYGGVPDAAAAPSRAAVVLRQRRAAVLCSAVGRLVAANGALDQRRLVGGGPLLRLVRAGAVAGPLAVVEQVLSVSVLLHAEELVLRVGQADPQGHAAVGHGDILLHPHLPGALDPTLVTVEDIEERGGSHVHGRHSHVVH